MQNYYKTGNIGIPRTLFWDLEHPEEPKLVLVDQNALPERLEYVECCDYRQVIRAIKDMTVRGAPAIGCAGVCALALWRVSNPEASREELLAAAEEIESARPTAVNLAWAVDYALDTTLDSGADFMSFSQHLMDEDEKCNRRIGAHGRKLLGDGVSIMTICNAGSLATAYFGTALGVIYAAKELNKLKNVWVLETRPRLQGARLTAWELTQAGVDFTLIVDSAAASVMATGQVDAIIVGADRIAANGDTANKIGTSMLAILAKHYGIPLYVAAPVSTFDLAIKTGQGIPIEERDRFEVLMSAMDVKVYNPAFDVTDSSLITAFITEREVIFPNEKGNYKLEETLAI